MTVINNTFSKNIACYGGGISSGAIIPVVNCILWDDSSTSGGNEIFGSVVVSYSDVEGGWQGEGNINLDPAFRDAYADDYHLATPVCGNTELSPCIDRGIASISDLALDCDLGLGDTLSDMGAYGGGNAAWPTGIGDDGSLRPGKSALLWNYPNPFNAATTISFDLAREASVSLAIFDITGARVATLINSRVKAGSHSAIWDAAGFPSGVYLARLEAGEWFGTVKLILLK